MEETMEEGRLPTYLWVDAALSQLNARGIFYYYAQKGNPSSGIVALKLNGLSGKVKLLIQERNFETGALDWVNALKSDLLAESEADAYIARAISRDPDLWVIEIEDPEMQNPFL